MQEYVVVLSMLMCIGSIVIYADESVQLSKPGADVELRCPLETPVGWRKDGILLSSGPHYKINDENRTLTIVKVISGEYTGLFTCNNSVATREITVKAAPVVKKFPERSVTLTEETELVLKCLAWGFPLPEISWRKTSQDGRQQTDLVTGDRVTLGFSDGLRNGSLTISDVTLDDYGTYTCTADNGLFYNFDNTSTVYRAEAEVLVRIKGKLMALWPFIGIILEIIVLITIIVIYERRKSKQDNDNCAKDSAPIVNSNDHKDK